MYSLMGLTLMTLGRAIAGAVVGLCLASAAGAHIVREEPWHPIPYAYRTAVFLLNLQPTDWDLIERKFTAADEVVGRPAAERIQELDRAAGTAHWAAIERALAERDAQALYAASTRALAHAIRHHLEQAAARLDRPGEARRELDEAERLYRGFADFIQKTDPERYRELGLAWLDLSSRLAAVNVAAAAGADAAFAAARSGDRGLSARQLRAGRVRAAAHLRPAARSSACAPSLALQATPWLPPGSDLNDQDPLPRLVLNFEEQGIDERDLFLVAFGDMLFEFAGDLRRAGAEPGSRLLDLPQPQRHQSAPVHPGDHPEARRDRRRRRLLQRPVQRSPTRCDRHPEPARHPVHGAVRARRPLGFVARLRPQRDRQRVRGRGAGAFDPGRAGRLHARVRLPAGALSRAATAR